jgi:multidrug efflux pump
VETFAPAAGSAPGFRCSPRLPIGQRKYRRQVIARLRVKLAKEPGAALFLVPVQDIRVGGRQANAQYQFTLQADDLEELRVWEPRVRRALGDLPELVDVNTDQEDKGLQTSLIIDRDTAAKLGVTPQMIDATLNDAFGQRQVSTIYNPLNQYKVVMEAAPEFWQSGDAQKTCMSARRAGRRCRCRPSAATGPPVLRWA